MVVMDLVELERPAGVWACLGCGAEWPGEKLVVSSYHGGWVCRDPMCGASVVLIEKEPAAGSEKPKRRVRP